MMMIDDPQIEELRLNKLTKNHLCNSVYNSPEWTYFDVCFV